MSFDLSQPERRQLLADAVAGRLPDSRGRFGPFGGRYVPETLIPALERLEQGVREQLHREDFQRDFARELSSWAGRPTALTHARHLSDRWGAHIWLKREDLAHTGAHKINNALGQALLAQRLGAQRIVAETGAGQHGVASAAACARLGLPCTVYMGEVDMQRQAPNVGRMRLLGATVVPVTSGDRTLRAAIDEALRDWVSDPLETYYLLGSAVGPHPYPYLVRELQSVIGREARAQMLERAGTLPDAVIACVGGGSNSIGLFHAFVPDASVEIIGVEAGGRGSGLGENAATLCFGRPGVLHGCYSLLLQDEHGQVQETHSISAGLDYSGVGPEHAMLLATGRARYESALDDEALSAVRECSESEGILPALESAHALAGARRWAASHRDGRILIGLSGRGDKDMSTLQQTLIAQPRGS
jgi:tryptophan synthase beta chain